MGCKVTEEASKPKTKHRKGLWSPEEDRRLRDCILKHGHGCWSSVPAKAGLQRNGKSCRLRWINYLRPGLKRGLFTVDEEETILSLHRMLGNKWSQIAQHLPGRTDNEIKNYWHTYLKKKAAKPEPVQPRKKGECNSDVTDSSSFEEPRHHLTWNPAKPTVVSSLPRSILFTEWLPQYSNINDNAHGVSLSRHYHCYEENDLMRMKHTESMDFKTKLFPDSVLQNAIFGDHNHASGALGVEELIDASYMKMEDQSSESGFLLDFTSEDYIYSGNQFTMSSDTMCI